MHGTIGLYGVVLLGIFGSGYPALQGAAGEVPTISLIGQIVGAIVFFLLGFVPGYISSYILNMLGMRFAFSKLDRQLRLLYRSLFLYGHLLSVTVGVTSYDLIESRYEPNIDLNRC